MSFQFLSLPVLLTVNRHGPGSGSDFGLGRLPQMIFDGESVDGNGELFGVNAGEFLLPAAVLVHFIQHFVGDDFRPVATQLFDSFRFGVKFEDT